MWFVAVQFVVVYNISPKHYLFVTCAQINLDYDYKNPFLNDITNSSYISLAEIS